MSEKKNIDRLFQEKFKDFEQQPNDAVWERIETSLPKKKKKRRVIALWWQIGGIAATIALLIAFGDSIFSPDNTTVNPPETTPIVDVEKDRSADQKDHLQINKDNKENNVTVTESSGNDSASSDDTGLNSREKTKEKETFVNKKNNEAIAKNSTEYQSLKDKVSKEKETSKTKVAIVQNLDSNQEKEKLLKSSNKKRETLNKDAIIKKESVTVAENTNNPDLDKNSNLIEEENNSIALNESTDNDKESIEEAIANNEELKEITKEKDESKWSIYPNIAPVYYGSIGNGSSLDAQFANNSKEGDITMSYGIKGSYKISNRLKVRAGLNKVDVSQTTADVFALSDTGISGDVARPQIENISFNSSSDIVILSSSVLNQSTAPVAFSSTIENGNLEQQYSFIEVPLELEYRLVDKKFGVNLIGGISTFFLEDNKVYSEFSGGSTLIGESNNINSTSFSANFGLGLDYSISKKWQINLEPTFKYQINAFENTSGRFNPFIIGVYTGLNFKF